MKSDTLRRRTLVIGFLLSGVVSRFAWSGVTVREVPVAPAVRSPNSATEIRPPSVKRRAKSRRKSKTVSKSPIISVPRSEPSSPRPVTAIPRSEPATPRPEPATPRSEGTPPTPPALGILRAEATSRGKTTAKPRPAAKAAGTTIQFSPSAFELGPGEEDLLEIRLANPYKHPTTGKLILSPGDGLTLSQSGWSGALPVWGYKFYAKVKADRQASGTRTLHAKYYVARSGTFVADYPVQVIEPVTIELIPDYKSDDSAFVRARVKSMLKSRTERGRVELKSFSRLLQDQVSALLPPIPPGETREVSIPVIAGGIAPGQPYRFIATLQTWAGYETKTTQEMVFYGDLK